MNVAEKKQEIRERIWSLLVAKKVAMPPFPVRGRIPNFRGALNAARRILHLIQKYDYILVSPDSPQRPVREFVLKHGKWLIMPTPRLKKGYLVVKNAPLSAATIRGAFRYGKLIPAPDNIELAVIGSVAVDLNGNRLGKGGGYGDREITLARKYNAIVATTVHSLQIVDEIPVEKWDQKIDIIATEKEYIEISHFSRGRSF